MGEGELNIVITENTFCKKRTRG